MSKKRILAVIMTCVMMFSCMSFGSVVYAEEASINEVSIILTSNSELPTGANDPDILKTKPTVGSEFYIWVLTTAVNELVGADTWVSFDSSKLSVIDMNEVTEGVQPVKIPTAADQDEVSLFGVTSDLLNTTSGSLIKYAASNTSPSNYPIGAVLLKAKLRVNAELTNDSDFKFARLELRGKLGIDNNPIRIIPTHTYEYSWATNAPVLSSILENAIAAGSQEISLYIRGSNLQSLASAIIELQTGNGTAVATTQPSEHNEGWLGVYPSSTGNGMRVEMRAIDPTGIPANTDYKIVVYRLENGVKVLATDCAIGANVLIDAITTPFVGRSLEPHVLQSGLNYPIDMRFVIFNADNAAAGTVFIARLEYGSQAWQATSVLRDSRYPDEFTAHFDFSGQNALPQAPANGELELKFNVYTNVVSDSNRLLADTHAYVISYPYLYDIEITPRESGKTSYLVRLDGWNLIADHIYTIKTFFSDGTPMSTFDVPASSDARKIEFTWDTTKGIPATGLPTGSNYKIEIWDGTNFVSSWRFGMSQRSAQIGGPIWFEPYYLFEGYGANTLVTIVDREQGSIWHSGDSLTVVLTPYPNDPPNGNIVVNNVTINEDNIVMQMPVGIASGIYRVNVMNGTQVLADNIIRVLGSGAVPKFYVSSSTSGGVTTQNWVEGRIITSDPSAPITLKLNGTEVQANIMAGADGFYQYRVEGLRPGENSITVEATNTHGKGQWGTNVTYNAPVPAAPTNGIVDDVNNIFTFTLNPLYPNASDYKYSLNNGETWRDCTSNVINVGNINVPAGHLWVRIKEDLAAGRPEGLKLLSTEPFTAPIPPYTPPAPTNGVVDDTANTFTFTMGEGFVIADYEYSTDNGATWTPCTGTVITVGDVAKPIGHVQVRVKATTTRPVGLVLSNGSSFTSSTTGANVLLESKIGGTDSIIQIAINVDNIKDFTGGSFDIDFDPAVVNFVNGSIENSDLTSGFNATANTNSASTGKVTIAMAGSEAVSGSGAIYRLNFKVVGAQGNSTAIALSKPLFKGENDSQIQVNVTSGSITVNNILIGDVSRNGMVDTFDVTLILRQIAGIVELSSDQLIAADTSGNGTVDTFDATLILRYIAGIIDKFPASNK